MAARIRNDTWKDDEELKRDLEGYAKQALKRDEVLHFVSKKISNVCLEFSYSLSPFALLYITLHRL